MLKEQARTHWPMWTLIIVTVVTTLWSMVGPHDWATWFFEFMCGWMGVALLVVTYRRFRFSSFAYLSCAFFVFVLSWGAKYTYADVPWFNWVRDTFELSRNHSDRFGHFFQGFVSAVLTREVIMRTTPLKRGKWLAAICIAMALAISALYELLEMLWVFVFYPTEGAYWLGHQGDMWDAHWDMTMALLGGMVVVFIFSRLHDRTIKQVTNV